MICKVTQSQKAPQKTWLSMSRAAIWDLREVLMSNPTTSLLKTFGSPNNGRAIRLRNRLKNCKKKINLPSFKRIDFLGGCATETRTGRAICYTKGILRTNTKTNEFLILLRHLPRLLKARYKLDSKTTFWTINKNQLQEMKFTRLIKFLTNQ